MPAQIIRLAVGCSENCDLGCFNWAARVWRCCADTKPIPTGASLETPPHDVLYDLPAKSAKNCHLPQHSVACAINTEVESVYAAAPHGRNSWRTSRPGSLPPKLEPRRTRVVKTSFRKAHGHELQSISRSRGSIDFLWTARGRASARRRYESEPNRLVGRHYRLSQLRQHVHLCFEEPCNQAAHCCSTAPLRWRCDLEFQRELGSRVVSGQQRLYHDLSGSDGAELLGRGVS